MATAADRIPWITRSENAFIVASSAASDHSKDSKVTAKGLELMIKGPLRSHTN